MLTNEILRMKEEVLMKLIKFLTLSIAIWFFVVSNFTIFDSDIRAMGEGFTLLCTYGFVGFIWYKCMRWLGFAFTEKQRTLKRTLK